MAQGSKEFPLNITIRTVDRATSGIKRINDSLEKSFGPFKKLGKELGTLRENMGLPQMAEGLRGIGSAVRGLVSGLGVVGGAGAAAVFAFKKLNDEFDNLGDTAERVGVDVDFLAQMHAAAERNGAEIEAMDSSLGSFNKTVGQAKAGTGRFASFLKKVSPVMLKQLKATGSTEEAFDLLADAMAKLHGQTDKQTALAVSAGVDPSLIPLLAKGSAGIAEIRKQFEGEAGSMKRAAAAAGKADDAWHSMTGSLSGVKAAIVEGLAPAFTELTKRAGAFVSKNRDKIAAWAKEFGEKLPGRINAVVAAVKRIATVVGGVIDKLGGAENAVKLFVAAFLTFKAAQVVGNLIQVGAGVAKLTKTMLALADAGSAAGASNASVALGLGAQGGLVLAAAAAGYALGTLIDQVFDLSGKLSNLAVDIFGPIEYEAVQNDRERGTRFTRMTDEELQGLRHQNTQEGRGAAQEWAHRSATMGHEEYARRANLGANDLSQFVGTLKPAELEVTFKNAPPGMRTETKTAGTLQLGVDIGIQTAFGGAR